MTSTVRGTATETALKDRDFTLIIDKSGSMATTDMPQGSRWQAAHETTVGLAHKMAALDDDGLTLYLFNGNFRRYDNVTAEKVDQVWKEHEPNGGTNLAAVLKDALDNYFSRRDKGKAKSNGEIICVITDGEPDSKEDVERVIVSATKRVNRDEEVGILFLQVGRDAGAAKFLQHLDGDLEKSGAKFDIVNTKTADEIGNMSLTDALLDAIND